MTRRKRFRVSWLSLSTAALGVVLMAACGLEAVAARLRRKGRSDELERRRVVAEGFMRCIQTLNNCDATGRACADKCGCRDEMDEWCKQ